MQNGLCNNTISLMLRKEFQKSIESGHPSRLTLITEPSDNTFEQLHFSYPHHRLVVCTSGFATFYIFDEGATTQIKLNEGDGLHVAPGAYFRSQNDSPYQNIGVLLRGNSSDIFLNDHKHQHHHRLMQRAQHDDSALKTWFDQLACCSNSSEQLLLAKLILTRYLQLLASERSLSSPEQTFENIVAYIHKHYHLTLNRRELASKFGIHENYLNRLFQRYKSKSYSNYLESLRLSLAKELLIRTNLPVTKVAEASGFYHSSYLSRRFKLKYELTPLQFRRRVRGIA